jgi:hypothetical protein
MPDRVQAAEVRIARGEARERPAWILFQPWYYETAAAREDVTRLARCGFTPVEAVRIPSVTLLRRSPDGGCER